MKELAAQTLDVTAFKSAVGSFACGVTIITVRDRDGNPAGMTATSFSSVSTDPFLVLVCVNRESRTYSDIVRSGSFGLNILDVEGEAISTYCARPGGEKVLPEEWLADTGTIWSAPAVRHSLAFLDCEVYRYFPAGTHGVIVGRVCAIGSARDGGSVPPLVHFRSRYCRVDEPLSAGGRQ